MVKRILICTGGTGGHVFPAEALAKQLKQELEGVYIAFAGGSLSKNSFFNKDQFPFEDISCGYFSFKNPLKCFHILKGLKESFHLIRSLQPDLVVGFGSFYSFPPLFAARIMRVPYVLHAADSIPGKVIRLMSRGALATGIVFPEARKYLKGTVVDIGHQKRHRETLSKEEALKRYGLTPEKKTLLVFGGSQGASFLNEILEKAIGNMQQAASSLQVIHLVGNKGSTQSLENAYRKNGISAHVKSFEERMDYAWTAADFVVSRAGSSTIAEQIEFEVPGLLIPYPHASENHQEKNADFMCQEVGGALKAPERDITSSAMANYVQEFLNRNETLFKMKSAIKRFKEKGFEEDMCSLVKRLIPLAKGDES